MLAALVLLVLIALAAAGGRAGWPGVVALAVVSVLWLLVNGPLEGPVLWTISRTHGLTLGDLAGLAGLLIAAWRGTRLLRRRGAVE